MSGVEVIKSIPSLCVSVCMLFSTLKGEPFVVSVVLNRPKIFVAILSHSGSVLGYIDWPNAGGTLMLSFASSFTGALRNLHFFG